MQPSKDTDHLAIYSDATYPVGPDAYGRITYVHVPPVSPFTIIVIALVCVAIAAFLCCYISPVVRKYYDSKVGRDNITPPVLASTRSLFSLSPQIVPSSRKPRPPPAPGLLARYGRRDVRTIARPQPALSLSRGSMLSPLLSPSLSSSCSTSPSTSPTPLGTPPMYSHSPISEVVVAPADTGIMRQTIENSTTPKKGGECYDDHKVEEV